MESEKLYKIKYEAEDGSLKTRYYTANNPGEIDVELCMCGYRPGVHYLHQSVNGGVEEKYYKIRVEIVTDPVELALYGKN